jgi:hypothetical protein
MTTGTGKAARLGEETIGPDEASLAARFVEFLKEASLKRHTTGPVRRFNQGRTAACVSGEFVVMDGLPDDLRVGLFKEARTYPAWIRFANASSETDKERDIRGMSFKLSGVPGTNLTPGSSDQDFVLNSHPVMMAPDTNGFFELLKANEAGGIQRILYFMKHLKAATIARAAQQNPSSHLDIPYWSAVPFRFGGPGTAVKYAVRPTSAFTTPLPATLTDTYLGDAMRHHLTLTEAVFDFYVQFQTDAARQPIEDATVEWSEKDSPYRKVAELHIPKQTIGDPDVAARCEASAFNPWNCLPEHQPIGGMNRARKSIYDAMAAFRAMHARR